MITHLRKTWFCIVLIFLAFNGKTYAQYVVNGKEIDTTFNTSMNHIFGSLDKTKIPFGILRDYAMEFTNMEAFNGTALVDSNRLDYTGLQQIYNTLATGR